MIEQFKYKGIWWLPDKDEETIAGTLSFDPNEGTVLDLMGSFQKIGDANRIFDPEIILGSVSGGKDVTLYECFRTKSTVNSGGLSTSSFNIDEAFIGVHFKEKEDIRFRKLSINYSYLDEWVNISGFDLQHFFNKKEVVIKYKQPESIRANIGENYKISIDIRATGRISSIMQKEASIKERTYITVEALQEESYDEYLRIVRQIQTFLSLGIMEPVNPLTVQGTTEMNKQVMKGKAYYPPVEIYHRLRDIPKVPKRLLRFDMLFTFKDISDKFEVLLKNWFDKMDLLEPVYDLYFGSLYNPRMHLAHQFLNAIHAIESYHRRIRHGKYLLDADYEEIRGVLVEAIPADAKKEFRDSLKSRIEFGNELSLRTRLKQIIDKHRVVFTELIGDKNIFVNTAVDTRNYYVHWLKERKESVATGRDLFYLTQKMRILLEISLLTELGFRTEEIKNLLPRSRKKKYGFVS